MANQILISSLGTEVVTVSGDTGINMVEISGIFGEAGVSPYASLYQDIIGYWKLDSTSGPRYDFISGSNLVESNTVDSVPGKYENAAHFRALNSASLQGAADRAILSMGDNDFTIAAWVNLSELPTNRLMGIVSKDDNTTGANSAVEYAMYTNSSDGHLFRFLVSNSTNAAIAAASTFGIPTTGSWHFVVGWHDSVADTINIQVNNGVVDSTSYSDGCSDETGIFRIGKGLGSGRYLTGSVDEVGFWRRVLTSDERTLLYNSGNGITINTPTSSLRRDLIAYWPLDEDSGTRADALGVHTLSDMTGSIYSSTGLFTPRAAHFTRSYSTYGSPLSIPTSASIELESGDSFTVCAWVKLDSQPAEIMGIVSKAAPNNTTGATTEWRIFYDDSPVGFSLTFVSAGNTAVGASDAFSVENGKWYLVTGWFDNETDLIGVQVNTGSATTAVFTPQPQDDHFTLEVGRIGSTDRGFDGAICGVGIWRRCLSSQEIYYLYNNGVGLNYPFG